MIINETFKIKLHNKQSIFYQIDWVLLTILFLFIYQPPLFSFNIVYFLIVLLNVISYVKYKSNVFKISIQLLKNRTLLYMTVCSSFLIMYLVFIGFFSVIYLKQIYTITLTLLIEFYCGFLIAQNFIMKKLSVDRFVEYFVLIGLVQATISIITYILPELRNNIVSFYIFRGYPKEVYLYMTWRLYGFSSTLTYAMPIVQSFISCLALNLGLNKRPVYFLAIPFLLFSSMINSRFGFIIFFPIAIFQIIHMQMKDHRFSKKDIAIIISSVVLCMLVLFFIVYVTVPSTWSWISSSFNDIRNFLNGNLTGYFAEIFGTGSSQFALPRGFLLLFGIGKNIMGGFKGNASDIGLVNDIWIGGILYAVTLWGMFLIVFSHIINKSVLNQKNLLITLLSFMLISNLKGMVITPNELISCVYVFLAFFILNLNSLD